MEEISKEKDPQIMRENKTNRIIAALEKINRKLQLEIMSNSFNNSKSNEDLIMMRAFKKAAQAHFEN